MRSAVLCAHCMRFISFGDYVKEDNNFSCSKHFRERTFTFYRDNKDIHGSELIIITKRKRYKEILH